MYYGKSMSFEEFDALPQQPGWKCEYYGGKAFIQPGGAVVCVTLPVAPRPVHTKITMRGLLPEDYPRLVAAYCKSFRDSADFFRYSAKRIHETAQRDVSKHFQGRGSLPASRVAVRANGARGEYVIGAALLLRDTVGPNLDLLFARPAWRRRGLANALVGAAVNALAEEGETALGSAHLLANAPSMTWHRRFGFIEEPDLRVTQNRYHCVRHEIERRETLGGFSDEERIALETERDSLRLQLEALHEKCDREGYEAVSPYYRRHLSGE